MYFCSCMLLNSYHCSGTLLKLAHLEEEAVNVPIPEGDEDFDETDEPAERELVSKILHQLILYYLLPRIVFGFIQGLRNLARTLKIILCKFGQFSTDTGSHDPQYYFGPLNYFSVLLLCPNLCCYCHCYVPGCVFQELMDLVESLKQQLCAEKKKTATLEVRIRQEVCKEFAEQLVEIENNYR